MGTEITPQSSVCECPGPLVVTNVDGNGGHTLSCPACPRNLPRNLTHCAGCDIPFDAPMIDPGCDPADEYVCVGCGGERG